MKIKKSGYVLLPIILTIAIITNGCRKTDRDEDQETQSSIDYGTVQEIFNDVFKQVVYYADTNSLLKLTASTCDTSWVSDSIFPKTLTIKFDSITGCTDLLNINHKGKIISTFSQKLSDSLAVVTTSFKNFYRNGYTIAGTQKITNKGKVNGATNLSMVISNASITTPSGKNLTWNAQLSYTMLSGDTTNTFADDVFLITGTSNGSGIKGTSYSTKIENGLRCEMSCSHLTSGTLMIYPGSLTPRTVDFGNGACDNSATVKLTGKSFTISLP